MAFGSTWLGKISELRPYTNDLLESKRVHEAKTFKFSIVLWLYVHEHCKQRYCAIFQRFNHDSKRLTPNLFLIDSGELFVEVYDLQGTPEAAITNYKLPLHQWCRLICHFRHYKV